MANVGDLILSAREAMTDLPSAMGAPTAGSPSFAAGSGGFLGQYYLVITQINQWGESLPSAEVGVNLLFAGNISIPVTFFAGAIGIRVYYGLTQGGENQYQQFTVSGTSATLVLNNTGVLPGVPPTRSTAYLPDTDGQAVGAYAIYRWINQALHWAAQKNRGGLPDFSAVGTTNGQPNYVMTGYWKKIDSAWFDGYPLGLLAKNNVFRRNPVPGYSGMLIVFQATDRLMVEAWPQPNRTSNVTVLGAPIGAGDSSAFLVSTAGYVLGFGMTMIGTEIVNFAGIQGNNLIGLTRGMGGTVPSAWPAGTICTELNLMIAGYRVPSGYSVGQAASTFYLPPGWIDALTSYLLYRFRNAEQDEASAQRYLKEATQKMSDLGANRIIAGPRQISPYSAIGPEVGAGLGTAFGGVIIP